MFIFKRQQIYQSWSLLTAKSVAKEKASGTAAESAIVGIITTRVAKILTLSLSIKFLHPASSNLLLFLLKPSSFSYKK
jgi:hypothetical protein